jgi:hypothetical protein
LHVRVGRTRGTLAVLVKAALDSGTTVILVVGADTLQVALRVLRASMIHTAEGSDVDLRHEVVDLKIPQGSVVVMNLGTHVPIRGGDRYICAIPELFRSRRLASAGIGRHVMPTEYAVPRLDPGRQNVEHRVFVRDEVASTRQYWAIVARCDRLNQLTLHGSLPKPAAFVALAAAVRVVLRATAFAVSPEQVMRTEALFREISCVLAEIELEVANVMRRDGRFDLDGATGNVSGCNFSYHVVDLVCTHGVATNTMLVLGLNSIGKLEDGAWASGNRTIVIHVPCYWLCQAAMAESRTHCSRGEHKEQRHRHR